MKYFADSSKTDDFYISKELESLIDLKEINNSPQDKKEFTADFLNINDQFYSFSIVKLSKNKNSICIFFHGNKNFITDLILESLTNIKLSLIDDLSLEFNINNCEFEFENMSDMWIVKVIIEKKEEDNGI